MACNAAQRGKPSDFLWTDFEIAHILDYAYLDRSLAMGSSGDSPGGC
jgi:hypothetical protein